MADYNELKNKMISTMEQTEAEVLANKNPPTTPQEIPQLFAGWDKPSSKAVQGALWIARKYNLIPEDSPLRQVWYAFIKLVFQNIVKEKQVGNPENAFYNSFADIIKKGDMYYSDYNILNDPAAAQIPDNYYDSYIFFPNTLIALEKESYFGVFKKFADLLGVHLYSGGGQPSLSASEEVARKISDKLPNEDLQIYTISDYDPAGMDIANTFKDHFTEYLKRKGRSVTTKRVAPNPEHYSPDELNMAKYSAKSIHKKRWNDENERNIRERYSLVDDRFRDPSFYDGNGADDYLSDIGESKKKDWKDKWKKRVIEDPNSYPHIYGLEVESLPSIPFDSQMPSGMNPSDAVGQARMRLIVFDRLIRDNDIGDVLENFMKRTFITAPNAEAETIIEEAIGFNELTTKRYDITEKLEKLDELIKRDLQGDIDDLAGEIRKWRNETIDEWKVDDEKTELFEDDLRRAVAKNYNQGDFRYRFKRRYPDIPETFTEWEAPLKSTQLVENQKEYYDKLLEELNEKINDLTPEEDEYDEEYDED